MYSRVLFVAPGDSGLDVMPELDGMYDLGYTVQSVQGDVTRARLFDLVSRRAKFGVIHFACHGYFSRGENGEIMTGVLLSRGERLDAASIVQLAHALAAKLVFLNACESASVGQLLVDQGVPASVCTLSLVSDSVARDTATVFYGALAKYKDPRLAYRESHPPVLGGYSIFTDGVMEQLQFGPVLEKLDAFAKVTDENNRAHADFQRDLARLMANRLEDLRKMRTWFLVVCISVNASLLFLFLLFSFIGRAR